MAVHPRLILVFGLPGSGKSFFAGRLAERLGAEYVNSDRIRKQIGASGKYNREDKLSVYHHMADHVRTLLEKNKVIVVDGTFYLHHIRELFIRLAQDHQVSLRFIEITTSPAVVKERLRKQREDSEADFRVYQLVKEQFEELKAPHLVLESTDDNIETLLKEGLEYIYSDD